MRALSALADADAPRARRRRARRTVDPRRSRTAAAATTAPPAAPRRAAPAPSLAPGTTLSVASTAYSLPGHTASGLPVGQGMCAVDPRVIPLGTRFDVPGYGSCVAADTGSAIIGATIDIWVPDARGGGDGRQTITITFR